MNDVITQRRRQCQDNRALRRAELNREGPPPEWDEQDNSEQAIDDLAQEILDGRESGDNAPDLIEKLAEDGKASRAVLRLSRRQAMQITTLDVVMAEIERGVEDAAEELAEHRLSGRLSRRGELWKALSNLLHALDGDPSYDLNQCLANARAVIGKHT